MSCFTTEGLAGLMQLLMLVQQALLHSLDECSPYVKPFCRESETDTVFEYMVDEATGSWKHWAGCVPAWTYPYADERPKFAQLVIPTLDSVR